MYGYNQTTGLLIAKNIHRQLRRDLYQADNYVYPIALVTLPDGRESVIHCPKNYDRLEIETLGGKLLTEDPHHKRNPGDFFHSRLQVSPSGKYLLDAGWVWHPANEVLVFDITKALEDPTHLDSEGLGIVPVNSEVESASFLNDELAVIYARKKGEDFGSNDSSLLQSGEVGIYSISDNSWISKIQVEAKIGVMIPLSTEVVLGLYEYPKLIELNSGRVLQEWRNIKSGDEQSSYGSGETPPHAYDPITKLFAIAQNEENKIIVIDFSEGVGK